MIAKRTIPLIIAALVGVLMIATYFVPYTEKWGADAMDMFIVLASAAIRLRRASRSSIISSAVMMICYFSVCSSLLTFAFDSSNFFDHFSDSFRFFSTKKPSL